MKKVLVIEDSPEVLENISELLELSHYRVMQAKNGREGIEKALHIKPDLILCDIMMPDLDGYGVLHMVQMNPDLHNIPFIFLSALTERNDVRKGMSLGADDYIPKPFDPTDLLNAIETRIRKAHECLSLPQLDELHEKANSESVLGDFVAGRHLDRYRRKERIYSEGNHPIRLFYVQKGKVKISRINDEGKELIYKIVNEGEFFGYHALLEEGVYHENAEALEPAEIAAIPKSEFDQLIHAHPEVSLQFIRLLASDVTEKEEQLIHIAYNSLRRKVADALIMAGNRFAPTTDGYNISLSRENLAAMAGTATESLIRTLTDFRNEKIIDIHDGRIAILQIDRLRKMVN